MTALLPPPFPTSSVQVAEEPAAVFSPAGLELEPVNIKLPPCQVLSLLPDPNRGGYKLLFVPGQAAASGAGEASAPLVYSSAGGTDWRSVEEAGVEAIAPTALGIIAGPDTETWLASGADGGIYLSAPPSTGERRWEKAWDYPLPEANNKYAPVAYVADPLSNRRVYAQFDHDTIHPSSRGLFLSEDGGRTWLESGVNGDANLSLSFPGKPWPDPRTPGKVYLEGRVSFAQDGLGYGSVPGMLVSADAGRTWSLLTGVEKIYGLAPGNRGTVLVGGTARSGGDGGSADTTHYLLTSSDGGATWRERALPFEPYQLVLDPAAPAQLVALGVVPGELFQGLYVFFSTDGGASWRKSGQPLREGTLLAYHAAGGSIFLRTAQDLALIGLK